MKTTMTLDCTTDETLDQLVHSHARQEVAGYSDDALILRVRDIIEIHTDRNSPAYIYGGECLDEIKQRFRQYTRKIS